MIVKMALYGLKSSGAAFRSNQAGVLREIGYLSTTGEPDVWIRLALKPDGTEYHKIVLFFVDDVLAILATPMKNIEGIKSVFKLKGDKAELPDMYIGASMQKVETADGKKCWMMSAEKYIKASVENFDQRATVGYLPNAIPLWTPPTIPVRK